MGLGPAPDRLGRISNSSIPLAFRASQVVSAPPNKVQESTPESTPATAAAPFLAGADELGR